MWIRIFVVFIFVVSGMEYMLYNWINVEIFGLCGCVVSGLCKKMIRLSVLVVISVLICWFFFKGLD